MSENKPIVWVSNAMSDTTLIKFLESDVYQRDARSGSKLMMRHTKGECLPEELRPKTATRDRDRGKLTYLPHLFQLNGFICVSQKAADVLREFDFGEGGGVFPLEVFQRDGVTKFEDGWHFMNFATVKQGFLPEQSQGVRQPDRLPYWHMPAVMSDEAIAVCQTVVNGADIWVDPLLDRAFFVRERLAKALKKAGLARAFRLYRCKMIEE